MVVKALLSYTKYDTTHALHQIGTLGDCTQSLHTWAEKMTKCIVNECQRTALSQNQITELIIRFHSSIGWDPVHKCLLSSSLLSSGTWGQILEATSQVLDKYSEGQISNTHEKVLFWNSNLGDIHANDKPLVDDLVGFFSHLRSLNEGVTLAICTSDDRRSTNSCMKNWNIEEYIDVSASNNYLFLSMMNCIMRIILIKITIKCSFRYAAMKY